MSIFAATFIALLVGHQVGDHIVQTDWMATNKAGKGIIGTLAMAAHVASYGATQAVFLALVHAAGADLTLRGIAAGLAVSLGTHAFIDRRWPVAWLLVHTGSPGFLAMTGRPLNGPYLADQSLHIGALFFSALTIAVLS